MERPSPSELLRGSRRQGVTLLEMLVAMLISSIIMMGGAMLYRVAMVNYNVARDVRDNLYTSTLTSDRITDELRKPNPKDVSIRSNVNSTTDDAIAFNFTTSAKTTSATSHSGLIYFYNNQLFLYENTISSAFSVSTGLFTKKSGSIDFINDSTYTDPSSWVSSSDNRKLSELIGYGVDTFHASNNSYTPTGGSTTQSRGTTWAVTYLEAGR